MEYTKIISKRFKNEYEKIYCRKDESFPETTIRCLIRDVEEDATIPKYDKKVINDYLFKRWDEYFEKHKKKVEERQKEGWW